MHHSRYIGKRSGCGWEVEIYILLRLVTMAFSIKKGSQNSDVSLNWYNIKPSQVLLISETDSGVLFIIPQGITLKGTIFFI